LHLEGKIKNLAGIETKINSLRLAEAADEKPSDDEKDQRAGNLRILLKSGELHAICEGRSENDRALSGRLCGGSGQQGKPQSLALLSHGLAVAEVHEPKLHTHKRMAGGNCIFLGERSQIACLTCPCGTVTLSLL
jgi:hypothetical protein